MVLKTFVITLSLLTSTVSFAQVESFLGVTPDRSNIEVLLYDLSDKIEDYFKAHKEYLAEQANYTKEFSEVNRESLEETRAELLTELVEFRRTIDQLAANADLQTIERSKHAYNRALTLAYLPRYEPKDRSLLTKILHHADPVSVDPIISRTEAKELFYLDFMASEGESQFNSKARIDEITSIYNRVVKNINAYRETNLMPTYQPKTVIREIGAEADIYLLMLSGEEAHKENSSAAKSCSRLF